MGGTKAETTSHTEPKFMKNQLVARSELFWEYLLVQYQSAKGAKLSPRRQQFLDTVLIPTVTAYHQNARDEKVTDAELMALPEVINQLATTQLWFYSPTFLGGSKGSTYLGPLLQFIKANLNCAGDVFDELLQAAQQEDMYAAFRQYDRLLDGAVAPTDKKFVLIQACKHTCNAVASQVNDDLIGRIQWIQLFREFMNRVRCTEVESEAFNQQIFASLRLKLNSAVPGNIEEWIDFLKVLESTSLFSADQMNQLYRAVVGIANNYACEVTDGNYHYHYVPALLKKIIDFYAYTAARSSSITSIYAKTLAEYLHFLNVALLHVRELEKVMMGELKGKGDPDYRAAVTIVINRIIILVDYVKPSVVTLPLSEGGEILQGQKITDAGVLEVFKKWAAAFLQNIVTERELYAGIVSICDSRRSTDGLSSDAYRVIEFCGSPPLYDASHRHREAEVYLAEVNACLDTGDTAGAKAIVQRVLQPILTHRQTIIAFKELIGLDKIGLSENAEDKALLLIEKRHAGAEVAVASTAPLANTAWR